MRILHIIPDLAFSSGGPVTSCYGLAEALSGLGHSNTIASTLAGYERKEVSADVDVRVFPTLYGPWRYAPQLAHYVKHKLKSIDIVMIEGLWQYPTYTCARLCRQARVPYVVSTNGMLNTWSVRQKLWKKVVYLGLLEGRTLQHAAALHATSEGEARNSTMLRWNSWPFVMPLGVNRAAYTDLPKRGEFAEKFPALKGRRFVLFLGRVHYKKQPHVLIQAFYDACGNDHDIMLVLAGPVERSYHAELMALARRLNIADRVLFTGILKGRSVTQAFRDADLFCLPSLAENFGIAVAEAMAAGCPVVISEFVDMAPLVVQYDAGRVTRADAAGTASGIRELMRDEAERRRLAGNARQAVLANLTWEKVAQGFVEVFTDILQGTRHSEAWRGAGSAVRGGVAVSC